MFAYSRNCAECEHKGGGKELGKCDLNGVESGVRGRRSWPRCVHNASKFTRTCTSSSHLHTASTHVSYARHSLHSLISASTHPPHPPMTHPSNPDFMGDITERTTCCNWTFCPHLCPLLSCGPFRPRMATSKLIQSLVTDSLCSPTHSSFGWPTYVCCTLLFESSAFDRLLLIF